MYDRIATANPFGQVLAGNLVISGPVKRATGFNCKHSWPVYIVDSYHGNCEEFKVAEMKFDDYRDIGRQSWNDVGEIVCSLMHKTIEDVVKGDWLGLVPIKTPNMEDTFIRIGLFESGKIFPAFRDYPSEYDLQGIAQRQWWDDSVEETVTII